MANKDDDRINNKSSSFNNKKNSSVKGKQQSTFDMFDINVKKAQQDVKKVFDDAKKQVDSFRKESESSTKKMLASISSQYNDFYKDLEKKHSSFIQNTSQMSSKLGTASSDGTTNKSSASPKGSFNAINSNSERSSVNQLDRKVDSFLKEQNRQIRSLQDIAKSKLDSKQTAITDKFYEGIDGLRDKLSSGELKIDSKKFEKEFGKLSKEYSDGMADLNRASTAIEIASIAMDAVKAGIDVLVQSFFNGMNKIISVYEATYTKVSVMTSTTTKDYTNWQNSLAKTLQEQGYANNTKIDEVMTSYAELVASGITDTTKGQQLAIANTMSKTLNPYLETLTDAYQDMQLNLGESFTENIKGLVKSTSENVGQSRFVVKHLNTMISQLEPLSINAKSDVFNKQFAEQAAILEGLVASGDITSGMAEEIKQKVYNATMDQYGTLQSGSAADILSLTQAYSQGIDPAKQVADYMKIYLGNTQEMLKKNGMTGQYETLGSGIVAENLVGSKTLGLSNLDDTDLDKIFGNANRTAKGTKDAANTLTSNYQKDMYQTATDLLNTQTENWSTFLATFKEMHPILSTILSTLGKGVTFLVGGKLLSSLIGNGGLSGLFGKFFGAKGLSGMAAKAGEFFGGSGALGSVLGSVATIGGGIALGVTAANVIKGAIEEAARKTEERNRITTDANLEGTALEGNAVASTLGTMGSSYSDENNNFMKEWGSGIATTVRGMGTGLFGWTRDLPTINQDDWKYMREAMNMSKMNQDQIMAYTLAWGLLLMSAGRKGDVEEFKNWNSESVNAVMKEYGFSRDYIDRVVASFGGTMTKPNKSTKENQESIDWSKIDGTHATGLDRVPVNGYIAQLHEGETVLTSTASKLLRSLSGISGGISGEIGIANAAGSIFDKGVVSVIDTIITPLKDLSTIIGLRKGSSSEDSEDKVNMKDVVDAIYDQTKVLKSTLENISINNQNEKSNDVTQGNATTRFTIQPRYNESLINLEPQMA